MKYQTFKSGVYAIYDLNKNCIYVGATGDFEARYRQHVKMIYCKNHHNTELQKYCEQIGVENLVFTPIFYCQESEVFFYEKKFIELLNPYANNRGPKLKKEDLLENAELYNKISGNYAGKWVSVKDLSVFLNENLKKTGMICKKIGYKSKKNRQDQNRMYFFIQ